MRFYNRRKFRDDLFGWEEQPCDYDQFEELKYCFGGGGGGGGGGGSNKPQVDSKPKNTYNFNQSKSTNRPDDAPAPTSSNVGVVSKSPAPSYGYDYPGADAFATKVGQSAAPTASYTMDATGVGMPTTLSQSGIGGLGATTSYGSLADIEAARDPIGSAIGNLNYNAPTGALGFGQSMYDQVKDQYADIRDKVDAARTFSIGPGDLTLGGSLNPNNPSISGTYSVQDPFGLGGELSAKGTYGARSGIGGLLSYTKLF